MRTNSLGDFYTTNEVQLQTYTINGLTGGTITSPNGTKLVIPALCFRNYSGKVVTGKVTVQFKDIYTKSDMLLNQVYSTFQDGSNLKSDGVFYINALINGAPVGIVPGRGILVKQPLKGITVDYSMKSMVYPDSTRGPFLIPDRWLNSTVSTIDEVKPRFYNHKVLQFAGVPGLGMWCNTSTLNHFNAFTSTTLTVNEVAGSDMDVFIVYDNVNTVIKLDKVGSNYFYPKAALGQKCTVVAISLDNNKAYASFTPVTITSNLILNPTLVPYTENALLAMLKTLN